MPFVVVGGIIISDGLRQLAAWYELQGREPGLVAARLGLVSAAVAAALFVQIVAQPAVTAADGYSKLTALPFGGATHVRQAPATTDALARIVEDVRTRCSAFVTVPGMNSFYLWSQRTPPTGLNATAWMHLLDTGQQQRVVDAISRVRRLCVVRNDSLLGFWVTPDNPAPDRPLWRYVNKGFKTVDDANGYQLQVRSR